MYKGSPQKGKGVQHKGPGRGEGQPPDLWIDHDHLELKQMGKDEQAESSTCISVASTRRNSLSSVHTNNQGILYFEWFDRKQTVCDALRYLAENASLCLCQHVLSYLQMHLFTNTTD